MEIILDTLKDTLVIIPILLIMYICLEYFEHKNIQYSHPLTCYGPLIGGILGIIPQCGFGVLASLLFIEKKLTLGTLISVFIATSDEAIPILLVYPEQLSCLIGIIFIKLLLAIVVGYSVDYIFKNQHFTYTPVHTNHEHSHSMIIEALIRTIKIYSFIFIVNIMLSILIEWIGTDYLSYYLLNQSLFQPLISAIFGFIPNCASSVILTQLHIRGVLSFASLLAGLITNAGLGLLILLQNRVDINMILKICAILLFTALLIAFPLQWLYLY